MYVPEELWPLRHEALNSIEGLALLYNLAAQACARQLPGDIVECGVYNGGSAAAIGLAIRHNAKNCGSTTPSKVCPPPPQPTIKTPHGSPGS